MALVYTPRNKTTRVITFANKKWFPFFYVIAFDLSDLTQSITARSVRMQMHETTFTTLSCLIWLTGNFAHYWSINGMRCNLSKTRNWFPFIFQWNVAVDLAYQHLVIQQYSRKMWMQNIFCKRKTASLTFTVNIFHFRKFSSETRNGNGKNAISNPFLNSMIRFVLNTL